MILTSAVLAVLSPPLIALCQLPPPPCDAMSGATHVFYGEVVESSSSPNNLSPDTISRSARTEDTVYRIARREVRFNVLNALKGVKTGMFTETFTYENRDPNEFRPGRRYLVYGSRKNAGQLSIECSRTRMVLEASEESVMEEIAQLEACVKKAVR